MGGERGGRENGRKVREEGGKGGWECEGGRKVREGGSVKGRG